MISDARIIEIAAHRAETAALSYDRGAHTIGNEQGELTALCLELLARRSAMREMVNAVDVGDLTFSAKLLDNAKCPDMAKALRDSAGRLCAALAKAKEIEG